MADFLLHIPFEKLGWALVQFLWISTIYLAGIALSWKVLERFSPKLKYNLGLGAILSLPFIPILLFVEHQGILPPIGLADWGPVANTTSYEPIIEGVPQFSGIDLSTLFPSLYYGLGMLWVIGSCLFLGYFMFSLIAVHINCQKRRGLNDNKIIVLLHKLAADLGIKANFKIKESRISEGPAVIGLFRSIILIPASLSNCYEKQEIEGLLLHELIHIKRKDYLFSLLQCIIRSIFFFQPLAWWLNSKVDRQRELVCDRAVTQITQDSHTYSSILIKLKLQTQTSLSHSLSIVNHSVVHRIRQLAHTNNQPHNLIQKLSRSSIVFLIVGSILFSTLWNSYHLHHSHYKHLQPAEIHQELNSDSNSLRLNKYSITDTS